MAKHTCRFDLSQNKSDKKVCAFMCSLCMCRIGHKVRVYRPECGGEDRQIGLAQQEGGQGTLSQQ